MTAALEQRLAQAAAAVKFSAESLLFLQQLDFARDPSRFKVACTTRRAGKTVADEVMLEAAALGTAGVTALYVAQTRGVAEELMWRRLKSRNDSLGLGGKTNDTKLVIEYPNGSRIRCAGAKDRKEADKLRGLERLILAVVDEAQNFRTSVIEYLINEILEPAMLDVKGVLVLSGTPGPVAAGYFYAACHNKYVSPHFWTLRDNPHLGEPPDEFLSRIRERRGITEDDPGYRREYLGQWVNDQNALVFKCGAAAMCDKIPDGGEWRYVVGFDVGFVDSDAIAILGWREGEKVVYLVDEIVTDKQDVTALAEQLRAVVDRYKPIRIVGDFGALGKKIGEEMRRRHQLPVEPADKTRKLEHVELLNAAMRAGTFRCMRGGAFAEDCQIIQWDLDERAKGVLKIAEDYHSDITDAVLYAFRACRAYSEREVEAKPEGYREPSKFLLQAMAEQRRLSRLDPMEAAMERLG